MKVKKVKENNNVTVLCYKPKRLFLNWQECITNKNAYFPLSIETHFLFRIFIKYLSVVLKTKKVFNNKRTSERNINVKRMRRNKNTCHMIPLAFRPRQYRFVMSELKINVKEDTI